MHPTAPSTQRTAAFDSAVMAYVPALKKLARKLDKTDYEELLQDTLTYVFAKWQNFRADPAQPRSGMYSWLTLTMRSIAQAKRQLVRPKHVEIANWDKPVAARQEETVFAGEVLSRLAQTREGRMLVRFAKGEKLREIGKRRGIGAERVRQLIEKARDRLVRTGVAA